MVNYSCESLDAHKGVTPIGGVKYSCEALEVVPGEEGFWRRFDHFITRDSKCASKIKGLIANLRTLDAEGKQKLANIKIDYGMAPAKDLDYMIKFSDVVFKFIGDNLENLKEQVNRIWPNSNAVKKAVRAFAKREADNFHKKWKIDMLDYLLSKSDLVLLPTEQSSSHSKRLYLPLLSLSWIFLTQQLMSIKPSITSFSICPRKSNPTTRGTGLLRPVPLVRLFFLLPSNFPGLNNSSSTSSVNVSTGFFHSCT